MYECVNLNKKNIGKLKELNFIKSEFNVLNEDFFEFYSNCNFAQQIMLKRKVKLIKNDGDYIGFIWYEHLNKNICTIKSIFCLEKHISYPYKLLLDNIKGKSIIKYNCQSNDFNFAVLNEIGFAKAQGVLELSLSKLEFEKFEYNDFLNKNNLIFREYKKGKDESLRCSIQNHVFEDENRTPLSVHDIYFDVSQDYYLEKGAVFLYKATKCIGYGQIILEKEYPFIVNVGILNDFRGLGYGKILMYHLLNIINENKYNEVRIKVKSSNFKALNLYRELGFKENFETFIWELKR